MNENQRESIVSVLVARAKSAQARGYIEPEPYEYAYTLLDRVEDFYRSFSQDEDGGFRATEKEQEDMAVGIAALALEIVERYRSGNWNPE